MPKDSFNDTSTAERPARTGSETLGSEGASPRGAKGTPNIEKADGTANMRADQKTKQAPTAPAASKSVKNSWPSGVQSYSDREV